MNLTKVYQGKDRLYAAKCKIEKSLSMVPCGHCPKTSRWNKQNYIKVKMGYI